MPPDTNPPPLPSDAAAGRSSVNAPPPPRPTPQRRPARAPRAILIVDWRRAWRMLSVHVAAVACTIGLLPPDQQAALLAALGVAPERLPLALGVLFLLARLVNQPAIQPGDAGPPSAPPGISENAGPQPTSARNSEI